MDNPPVWDTNVPMGAAAAGEEEEDIDEDSFRSDLERDSARSSLVMGAEASGFMKTDHEARHEQLLKQGNIRESLRNKGGGGGGGVDPDLTLEDIHLRLREQVRQSLTSEASSSRRTPDRERPRPSAPPPQPPTTSKKRPLSSPRDHPELRRAPPPLRRRREPKWYNLFGLIDVRKLKESCCCGGVDPGLDDSIPHNPRYNHPRSSGRRLETIPENQAAPSAARGGLPQAAPQERTGCCAGKFECEQEVV